MRRSGSLGLALLLVASCSDDASPVDAGAEDAFDAASDTQTPSDGALPDSAADVPVDAPMGMDAALDAPPRPDAGADGIVLPRGVVVPLPEAEQTYRGAYDSLVADSESSIADILDNPFADYSAYAAQHYFMAAYAMLIATGDEEYAAQFVGWAERAMAQATVIDRAGKRNWGGDNNGNGDTRWTEDGSPVGYLLNEIQGGSMMALGGVVIAQQSQFSRETRERAEAVVTFVREHIADKWYERGSFIIEGTIAYLDGNTSYDQPIHLGTLYRALDVHTPSDQHRGWADYVALRLEERMVDSVANAGRTPIDGARVFDTGGALEDASHASRIPFGMFVHWTMGGREPDVLEQMGRHFQSMIWNQSDDDPGFSQSLYGGEPYGGGLAAIFHGWPAAAAVSTHAQEVVDAAAAASTTSSISGNATVRAKLNFYAWQMAGRAFRESF